MPKIALADIRIDGGTQARIELNLSVVKEYSEHLKDGDKFPPVIIFRDSAGSNWLADGFHRYHAHKDNGLLEIEATIKEGSVEDATLFAFGANAGRGLSMSWEDNRNIIKRMLEHPVWSKWSNSEIAKHVGVSKMTVGRVKQQLAGKNPQPTKKTYKNKHGQEATMETKSIGKNKPVTPVTAEESDKLHELTETISGLHAENELLRDKIAIGQWDASEIEKIDIQETVNDLRKQIRVLEIDNKALRDSRDMFQARNAELMKTVKSLQSKLKKFEA